MGKKIVILNGSPRKKGNTSVLVKSFTEGAESAGNTVTEFFLSGMDIHGCRGCFGGHSSRECPCVQKDDMAQIYPAVKESDVVVLATPFLLFRVMNVMTKETGGGTMQEIHKTPGSRKIVDADPEAVEGIIKIKCPICKSVIAVSFHRKKVRTERIGV